MILNIRINEQHIMEGDISPVRKELEVLTEDSDLIKKYQNSVGLTFMNFTLFDIVRKLKMEEYGNWFKKLDKEIPGLPHFLTDKDNALLIYLMGNIPFEETDGGIIFDRMAANRFFKAKQAQIRNLCLSNNINPESDLNRISAILAGKKNDDEKDPVKKDTTENTFQKNEEIKTDTSSHGAEPDPDPVKIPAEKEDADKNKPKKSSIKNLLDKYGSIAFMTNDRFVKLTIALNELPEKLAFSNNFLVKDRQFPQSFFSSVISTEKGNMEVRSFIIPNIEDVESSINSKKGVQIQVVYRVEDGSYQKIFESEKAFPVKITTSIESELKTVPHVINDENEMVESPPESSENNDPAETLQHKKPENIYEDTVELKNEVDRLFEENGKLREKVLKLEKLIEIYEDEIHKKRSVKNFFKKFLG